MLQISTASILEKNRIAQDSAWLSLLEVQAPGEIIRLVHNNEDILWDGQTWTAFPFMIDSVKQSKTEVPQVPVKISNITRAIEQYIEQHAGLVGCTVVLRVVNSRGSYRENGLVHIIGDADIEETFTIQHTNSDSEWATFNLGGSMPIMMRFPFTRILKDWCPYKFGGIECAYWGTAPPCSHTLQSCRERGNSSRFGGEPGMSSGGIYASNN